MATGWFVSPYKRKAGFHLPGRYVQVADLSDLIAQDGGAWSETEVLGNQAIVKVRASVSTLQAIANTPGIRRLPVDRLNDPLSSLSTGAKNALRTVLTDAGYTLPEVQARFGADIGTATLGDVLRFMATRRKVSRYDSGTDSFIFDGANLVPRPVDAVDGEVQ